MLLKDHLLAARGQENLHTARHDRVGVQTKGGKQNHSKRKQSEIVQIDARLGILVGVTLAELAHRTPLKPAARDEHSEVLCGAI